MRTDKQVRWPSAEGVHEIELKADEWVSDPSSTKHVIVGPGTVTITRWADGGIDAQVGTARRSTL
jgi:hypothetical protein